ncbi:hypothetical protein Tco_0787637 [Tanacetum coccineum]
MLNPSPDTGIDSIFNLNTETTSLIDVPVTTIAEPPLLSTTNLPSPPTPLIIHLQQTPIPTPATAPSSSLQDLPNFGSLFGFDHRLKTLETDFYELKQTNQFAAVVSSIPGIVDAYLANKIHETIKTAVQLQSDRLRDEAQAENEDFINKLDDNIKKIINEQTSHDVAANLSKFEMKKILIDKMESNKSIHISDEQKNLYKALVDAYKNEEPFAGSNRGSKRRRAGKEPEPTSALKEKTSKTIDKSTKGSKSHHKFANKSAQAEEPMHTAEDLEEPAHQEFDTGLAKDQPFDETTQHHDCSLARKEDTRDSFNELMDTPLDFSAFVMNRIKVDTLNPELLVGPTFELMKGSCKIDTLNPELLVGPTFELMKGSCKSLVELEYFLEEVYKATTDQLDWNNPEGQNDDKLYTFKEGDYKRLRLQDIEDMLLLLVQVKLTNLTIEERLALNISLRMFTRRFVIQRRMEDL